MEDPAAQQEMTDRQKQAMLEALSNPLVLHKIIKSTRFSSLKKCRQISQSWRSIGDEAIGCRCKIHLVWDEGRSTFVKFNSSSASSSSSFNENDFSLENLFLSIWRRDLFSSVTNFEFSGSSGKNCLFHDDRIIGHFFKIVGPSIRTLKLSQMAITSKSKFLTILNRLLPNLENLIFKNVNFYFHWTKMRTMREETFLMPSLKFFEADDEMAGGTETIYRIVRGAPNLKYFGGFRLLRPELMDLIGDDDDGVDCGGKILVVKQLNCGSLANPNFLSKFLAAQSRGGGGGGGGSLQKLEISGVSFELARLFTRLLETNKNSLTQLSLTQLDCLGGIEMPAGMFRKLKFLQLTSLGLIPAIFLGSKNSKLTFQNLKILDISSSPAGPTRITWADEALDGILGSVDTLKVGGGLSDIWMKQLHRLCPNFKKLTVSFHHPEETGRLWSKVFWLWPHLVTLDLYSGQGPRGSCGGNQNHVTNMDSIFTGILPQICGRLDSKMISLTQQSMDVGSPNFFEGLRTGPSIGDLRELRKLTLHLKISWEDLVDPFISDISALGGFGLMPNLEVHMIVTHDDDERVRQFMTQFWNFADVRFEV